MRKSFQLAFAVVLLATLSSAQAVKPPYILGKNDVRIKSKNFLAGRKPSFGSQYTIYQNGKNGFQIYFDKRTNEFEIVTGADGSKRSLSLAKQDLRNAETITLRVTGIASEDKCKLKVLMRIVIPGSTDGGLSYDHLPGCGEF
jgi:hypothetical protein